MINPQEVSPTTCRADACAGWSWRQKERTWRQRAAVGGGIGVGGDSMEEENRPKAGSKKRKWKADRLEYLGQLVVEFGASKSDDAKEQVLANLANFAYDPANYDYFRQLNVLDLFLDALSERQENLIKFSIGGLCNLSLEPENRDYISKNGLSKIIKLLNHKNLDIVLPAVTTLMFLMTPETKAEITCRHVVSTILKLSKTGNSRIENLTAIFLEDYCTEQQIKEASMIQVSDIPLPEL